MTRRRCATMLRWTLPLAALLVGFWTIGSIARADSPRFTSVTLHEGLNIVAWTGERVSIDDFVGGLPATPQAVFARDPATGRWRFWGASVPASLNTLRAIPSGAVVGLRMSAPPLGPWTYEQAESLPPAEIGPELTAGRYQLVWHERGEARLDDALRGLGDALERVWRWDALAQRDVVAPSDATVRYGDVLTLEIGSPVYWARPTDEATNIVRLGAVSAERKAQVRAAIDEARDWFADEYGVETADFTLYYGDDIDAIIDGYRRLEPEWFNGDLEDSWRSNWHEHTNLVHQSFDHVALGGAVWEWAGSDGLRSAAAEMYFRILRARLAGHLESTAVYLQSHAAIPPWLLDGSSAHVRERYLGHIAYRGARSWAVDYLADVEAPLSAIATRRAADAAGLSQDAFGTLAIEWLIAHAGEDAFIEFWRQLRNQTRWQDAFAAAFHLTATEFYARYKAWRGNGFLERLLPGSMREISGQVLGPDQKPVPGLRLHACPEDARSGACLPALTDGAGRYSFSLPTGRYMLSALLDAVDCTVSRNYDGRLRDLTDHWSRSRLIDVRDADADGRDIHLSARPGSAESVAWCDRSRPDYFGIEFVPLTGQLLGPEGPLGGVHLYACLHPDEPGRSSGTCYRAVTAGDGRFFINLPKHGTYQISVEPTWNRCITHGWYADGGPSNDRSRAQGFIVEREPVSGVDLRLPQPLAELPEYDRC